MLSALRTQSERTSHFAPCLCSWSYFGYKTWWHAFLGLKCNSRVQVWGWIEEAGIQPSNGMYCDIFSCARGKSCMVCKYSSPVQENRVLDHHILLSNTSTENIFQPSHLIIYKATFINCSSIGFLTLILVVDVLQDHREY